MLYATSDAPDIRWDAAMDAGHRALISRRCTQIAGRQYGVISREQALAAGMTPRQIDRTLSSGRWRRMLPSTYVMTAATTSLQQRAMATVKWAGQCAAVSHETSCALRRFANARNEPIEISCHRRLRSELAVVHRVEPWRAGDVEFLHGIPVTSIERTLVDMSRRELAPRLQELLDEALRRSLTSVVRLDSYVRAIDKAGRYGPAAFRLLLQRYMKGGGYSESILETRLRRLLENSPIPDPVAQYVVRAGNHFVARVDFAWPDRKVAVEAVGRAHHEGQWEQDVARLNALVRSGWVVIFVTWEDLHIRPRETLLSIARALGVVI